MDKNILDMVLKDYEEQQRRLIEYCKKNPKCEYAKELLDKVNRKIYIVKTRLNN